MNLNKIIMALCLSTMSYQTFAGSPIEPIMIDIPSGSFEMGSMARESSQPLHEVNISKFSLGKYEVTVKEFAQFIKATNYKAPSECRHELDGWFKPYSKGNWETNSINNNEFQPVVCINWQAANAYTQWLAKETGKPYRLPTEAEWEYAARAGTKTDYFFGNDEDRTQVCEYANTADLSGENILQRDANTSYLNWSTGLANCVDHSGYASIVGMYKPNQFGLHDMVSNVLEMLADCYVENYKAAPTDGSAMLEGECTSRATRGGSWHWNNWPLAQRGSIPEDFSGGVDGFRIALDGPVPKQSQATNSFAAQLKHAQNKEQNQRDLQSNYPDKIANLRLTQADGLVNLTWDASSDPDVDGYRIYRNDIAGTMVKLIASNIKETSFKYAHSNDYVYEYTVVAVKNHQQGMYSDTVKTAASWLKVPGRIEAESAAQDEGVVVTRTSDDEGKYNLTGPGGISNKAKLDYQIEVAQSGEYELTYRVASPRDTKGFTVLLNGKKIEDQKVIKTGGYHEWQTQQGGTVYLKKGKNKLSLNSLDNNWKLNWLALKQN